NDSVPFRKRIGFRLLADSSAGVVDKDIDATKASHSTFDHCATGLFLRDIELECCRVHLARFYRPGSFKILLSSTSSNDNRCTGMPSSEMEQSAMGMST